MPGKLSLKRSHSLAIRAANMKSEGFTSRQIAIAVEKKPEQIKAMVLLGQRLQSLTTQGSHA
ncbi:MAG: hypothetical protein RR574_19505 [Comamonas sp.]